MERPQYGGVQLDEWLKQVESFVRKPVRGRADIFRLSLEGLINDPDVRQKAFHLYNLYAASLPILKPDTKKRVLDAFGEMRKSLPTIATEMGNKGSAGRTISMNISRDTDEVSVFPDNDPRFLELGMTAQEKQADHTRYDILMPLLGDVLDDLVSAGKIPEDFDTNLPPVDISILKDDAKPQR